MCQLHDLLSILSPALHPPPAALEPPIGQMGTIEQCQKRASLVGAQNFQVEYLDFIARV